MDVPPRLMTLTAPFWARASGAKKKTKNTNIANITGDIE
jgi:hypothetical protein